MCESVPDYLRILLPLRTMIATTPWLYLVKKVRASSRSAHLRQNGHRVRHIYGHHHCVVKGELRMPSSAPPSSAPEHGSLHSPFLWSGLWWCWGGDPPELNDPLSCGLLGWACTSIGTGTGLVACCFCWMLTAGVATAPPC